MDSWGHRADNTRYYLSPAGQLGPFNSHELQKGIAAAPDFEGHLVWRYGMSDWQMICSVPELNAKTTPLEKLREHPAASRLVFIGVIVILGAILSQLSAAMGAMAHGSQERFTNISAAGPSLETIDRKATSITTSDELPVHSNTTDNDRLYGPKSAADNGAISTRSPDEPRKRPNAGSLSAAEVAALIVQASGQQYYATGHPCACPDDVTGSGRRCGGNSAHSRPGGAAPLCYVTDVSDEMIAKYRTNMAPGARLH
jgi:GYF domain 2